MEPVSVELPKSQDHELPTYATESEVPTKSSWATPRFESFPLNGALGAGALFRAKDFIPHFGVS